MSINAIALSFCVVVSTLAAFDSHAHQDAQPPGLGNVVLSNGRWFDGKSFERKTVYSVDGRFTFKKPSRIDHQLDLNDAWIVPPFADAHSHSLGLGVPGADAPVERAPGPRACLG
jgi:hypothetical protein